MLRILKTIVATLSVVAILIVVVFTVLGSQVYRFWLQQPKVSEEILIFEVEEGSGLSAISNQLKSRELISSPFWFKVYTYLDGSARKMQAGDFDLQHHMNYADMVDVLIDANSEEVSITIPEGYTLKQIGEVVAGNFDISKSEWALMTGLESPLEDHPFVVGAEKPENVDLEGYLFPDTYRFFANADAEEVAITMLEEMEENVEKLNFNYGRVDDVENLHDLLTLASIVEREVRAQDEMGIVAGIFYNRLEIGMALQADSTINYFTGKDTPSVSFADTEISSPYNTYRNVGLPPGAISNPGINALIAVANPSATEYFYFLTSPDGEVFYAVTFNEHVENKNRHLR